MATADTSLGATLRTWRDRVAPENAGFYTGGARRVAGLRREEVAELAGVSVDYLVRLEQGRATAPSGDIVAALARVLRLTRAERDHLYRLAGLQPPGRVIGDEISPGVRRLLARLGEVAVAVFTADLRLLWWSAGWAALLGDPALVPPDERDLVRAGFPVAGFRGRVAAWPVRIADVDASDRAIVADLRRASARYPDDRGLAATLARTLEGNARFAELWRAGAVGAHVDDRKTVEHPIVGDVAVDCDVLHAVDADLNIVALTAAAGSEDAAKLERALAHARAG